MIIINEHSRRIVYLSQTYSGKTHDKKVADSEDIHFSPNSTLIKDTGFQGYEPAGIQTYQPHKKPKGKDLGIADRFFNRMISSVRIRVEHVIAGIKRCHIVNDVFRNKKEGFSDLVMRIACALHNWRTSFRHPKLKVLLFVDYFR